MELIKRGQRGYRQTIFLLETLYANENGAKEESRNRIPLADLENLVIRETELARGSPIPANGDGTQSRVRLADTSGRPVETLFSCAAG